MGDCKTMSSFYFFPLKIRRKLLTWSASTHELLHKPEAKYQAWGTPSPPRILLAWAKINPLNGSNTQSRTLHQNVIGHFSLMSGCEREAWVPWEIRCIILCLLPAASNRAASTAQPTNVGVPRGTEERRRDEAEECSVRSEEQQLHIRRVHRTSGLLRWRLPLASSDQILSSLGST